MQGTSTERKLFKMTSAQKWVDSLTFEKLHSENELIREKLSRRCRAERDWVQIKVALLESLEKAENANLSPLQAEKPESDTNVPKSGESA